ncbi:sigma-70 family RNA polymerase sigma factor [Cytophagaceae bacterium DM2B3-1]|uniref:Sigma-70 family RNA polymerase sigma factor n=1 Tax=Xanthocytophaga flava TaxID=3048013 RepID=A0ABT7CFW3_9BACT|nr:sigma-70 family RNA polymerase sigma factor [Xanthocytophaga flavus]MDJ1466632.1 sigma-70 family RNA polymerase sigma factor [Xanthocytophaga flavus]MDJ1492628.1 sigma-70 family RNA polymerase sigma factor [Xanthocytophaga flavus]
MHLLSNHDLKQEESSISANYPQNGNASMEYKLWNDFKDGDMEAYAILYRQNFFSMYQYGRKICDNPDLVKDTIQDVFIKIWNNRENLSQTTSIRYYLLTALKRKLLDTLKSAQMRTEVKGDWSESELQLAADGEDENATEQRDKVLNAINRLSDHQQRLLQLKFYKNLSNQEIADELGITIQSVYNSVFKTLKNLRQQLSLSDSIWVIVVSILTIK